MNRKPVLLISLDRRASQSLQDQLAEGLKRQILSGDIPAGHPIPSSREIARDLQLSRNTVLAACDRLLGEGYLQSVSRSGLFVSEQLEGRPARSSGAPVQSKPKRNYGKKLDWPKRLTEAVPFRPCRPDVRLFPLARWNRHRTRALKYYGSDLFQYQPACTLGLPALRKELASYLGQSRGVQCDWQQIAITSGSQQALFILSQLILRPGDRVLWEDPGYPGARNAFAHSRARIVSMKIDQQGALPDKRHNSAKLIYVSPSRQFPTGATMPVARRIALLDASKRLDAWLVEDDYDSEFRYARPPLPSLHSLAGSRRVIYLGTMSKVLCPTLRIGYIVLPPELVEPFERLRLVIDDQGPMIEQATLAYFLSSGDFYAHIRKCRKAYASRLEAFISAVKKCQWPLDFPHIDGGMNQAGFFQESGVDDRRVSRRLAERGFDIPALSTFSVKHKNNGLLFGFTAFDERSIAVAVKNISSIPGLWR